MQTAAFCLVLLTVPAAFAQSIVLYPSKTNTLIQVTSGTTQQLGNALGDIFVGRTNQDGQDPPTVSIRRGLIAFDVADSIPAGATITAATLTLDDVQGQGSDQTVTLSRLLRDRGQGTSYFSGGRGTAATNGDATWYYTFYNAANPAASPAWSSPGGKPGIDFASTASASATISANSDSPAVVWSSSASSAMLADIQRWLDNPSGNFGWIVLGDETAGKTAQDFAGEQAASPEFPPQLAVQYKTPWIWTGNSGSGWSSSANWTNGSGIPDSQAAIVLGSSASTGGTIDLGTATPTISHLSFDANRATTITDTAPSGGQLTLDNGSSPAAIVISGSGHRIDSSVAIDLNSDAWIIVSNAGDSLSIAGGIANGSGAHSLTKDGAGTLVLSGDSTFSGGTTLLDGTLIIAAEDALPNGTSLTVGDSNLFAIPPQPSAIVPVPEPGTLALLLVGAALMTPFFRFSKKA